MMDWPVVVLILGVGGLGLGAWWLSMLGRKHTVVGEFDDRLRKLEALLPSDVPLPLPRGLPGRMGR